MKRLTPGFPGPVHRSNHCYLLSQPLFLGINKNVCGHTLTHMPVYTRGRQRQICLIHRHHLTTFFFHFTMYLGKLPALVSGGDFVENIALLPQVVSCQIILGIHVSSPFETRKWQPLRNRCNSIFVLMSVPLPFTLCALTAYFTVVCRGRLRTFASHNPQGVRIQQVRLYIYTYNCNTERS